MLIKLREWINNNKKKTLALGFLLLLIFLFLLSLILGNINKSTPAPGYNTQQSQSGFEAPKVSFNQYTAINGVTPPVVPQTVKAYTFKNNFTDSDIKSFAGKLGLTDYKTTNTNYVIVSNSKDMHKRGIISFDKVTGSFVFQSFADLKPSSYTPSMPVGAEALAMLSDLGISDPTLKCPITYQEKNIPFTFVECHRDWNTIGSPILSPIGLLNIPETTSLSSLQEGTVDKNTPVDPNITNVLNNGVLQPNSTGKVRPNDFNTVTVAIDPKGFIRSIDSNLRIIDQTKTTTKQANQLITPQQAYQKLRNHNNIAFSLTIPSGSGTIDWQKVYPENLANSQTATITDETLSYIEKPQDTQQSNFVPMYVFRGYATLDSGYRVTFVQMVPALTNNNTFLTDNLKQSTSQNIQQTTKIAITKDRPSLLSFLNSFLSRLTHPVYAQNEGLQLKTFNPTGVVTQSPPYNTLNPTTVPPDNSQNPNITPPVNPQTPQDVPIPGNFGCNKANSGLGQTDNVVINVSGLGKLIFAVPSGKSKLGENHTFYFQYANFPVSNINDVRKALYTAVSQQAAILLAAKINKIGVSGNHTINTFDVSTSAGVKRLIENYPSLDPKDFYSNPYDSANQFFADMQNAIIYPESFGASGNNLINLEPQISQIVASAVQNNQLAALAGQPNLFPSSTLDHLSWVLFDQPGLHGYACYVSGASPVVFVYSSVKESIHITLPQSTTYMDPASTTNQWDVLANPNGLLQLNTTDQIVLKSLYYEYNSAVSFTNPQAGFIVTNDNWKSTILTIANKLGLNKEETNTALAEVQNVISTLPNSKYIKISLADTKELNSKLSLIIMPTPQYIYRFNFLITPVSENTTLVSPKLDSIQRGGLTVVEIGARELK